VVGSLQRERVAGRVDFSGYTGPFPTVIHASPALKQAATMMKDRHASLLLECLAEHDAARHNIFN